MITVGMFPGDLWETPHESKYYPLVLHDKTLFRYMNYA